MTDHTDLIERLNYTGAFMASGSSERYAIAEAATALADQAAEIAAAHGVSDRLHDALHKADAEIARLTALVGEAWGALADMIAAADQRTVEFDRALVIRAKLARS